MRLNQQQTLVIGTSLIVLGIVMALNLWALLPVLVLGGAGAYLYRERRRIGRTGAAVQSGIWLIGLALLFLIDFVVPGIIILAGLSLLARGREAAIDARVVSLLARFGVHLPGATTAPPAQPTPPAAATPAIAAPPAQPIAAEPAAQPAQPATSESAATGETIRL